MLQQEPVTTFIGQEAEPERRVAEACAGRRDRKSHARAIDNPIWIATPLTAAMVILSRFRIDRISSCEYVRSSAY